MENPFVYGFITAVHEIVGALKVDRDYFRNLRTYFSRVTRCDSEEDAYRLLKSTNKHGFSRFLEKLEVRITSMLKMTSILNRMLFPVADVDENAMGKYNEILRMCENIEMQCSELELDLFYLKRAMDRGEDLDFIQGCVKTILDVLKNITGSLDTLIVTSEDFLNVPVSE